MPPPNCVAIILTGHNIGNRCTQPTQPNNNRCNIHQRSIETSGPHATARKELRALHTKAYNDVLAMPGVTDDERDIHLRALTHGHAIERANLLRDQRRYVLEHGNPDVAAHNRRNERRNQRIVQHNDIIFGILGERVRIAPPVNELGAFAHDNQNVHTTHAVKQTTDIIKKILEIKVPVRYQWNKHECSKTPGHIIMQCKLSPTAAWQMTAKYCQAETIYEMGEGIYGRVLDCVWQFILASPDREDLMKIVKVEMQDNIGMCAQGNLSRLCNILSGYLDDVVIRESPAEIMGRMISSILETADITERARKMTEALIESRMPVEKWHEWAEPAFDERIVVSNNKIQIAV